MADLEWESTLDGYESAGYRIHQLGGRPLRWRLETIDDPVRHGARAVSSSVHPTLADAKRRARRDEQARVRRARVRGHAVVGLAAVLVFAALIGSMRSADMFLISMIFLYVALRSLVDAVAVQWGEAWAWTRAGTGPEQLSWSGRWVLAAVEHVRRRRLAVLLSQEPPAIIMLPPGLPERSDAG
jgi:hypothetical protein